MPGEIENTSPTSILSRVFQADTSPLSSCEFSPSLGGLTPSVSSHEAQTQVFEDLPPFDQWGVAKPEKLPEQTPLLCIPNFIAFVRFLTLVGQPCRLGDWSLDDLEASLLRSEMTPNLADLLLRLLALAHNGSNAVSWSPVESLERIIQEHPVDRLCLFDNGHNPLAVILEDGSQVSWDSISVTDRLSSLRLLTNVLTGCNHQIQQILQDSDESSLIGELTDGQRLWLFCSPKKIQDFLLISESSQDMSCQILSRSNIELLKTVIENLPEDAQKMACQLRATVGCIDAQVQSERKRARHSRAVESLLRDAGPLLTEASRRRPPVDYHQFADNSSEEESPRKRRKAERTLLKSREQRLEARTASRLAQVSESGASKKASPDSHDSSSLPALFSHGHPNEPTAITICPDDPK